jgi:hypothetical protein
MIYSSGSGTFSRHIFWYCDMPYGSADNPFYDGKLTKSSDISRLWAMRRTQMISGIGYLNIEMNVLHQLQFCDRSHGLNESVPANMLHTFQLDIYIYVLEGLFGKKKASVVKKRKRVV